MRKQTKLVAVLSAAALLAIGASMTSFAATGWAEENGSWVYYDKDGYQVTNEWRKSGNNWFFLNDDGEMAADKLVDDDGQYYYVDENGSMVTNRWVKIENEDYYDEDTDEAACWYYFQANGKAYKGGDTTSFKTINGKKYAFDSEGKMLYGWVNTDSGLAHGDDDWSSASTRYYCGDADDGARVSGWFKGAVVDGDEDKEYWFYFNASGKKLVKDLDDFEGTKKINGKSYTFDDRGVMVDGWQATPTDATPTSIYYDGSGARQKGWFKVVPDKSISSSDKDDETERWFYGESNGEVAKSILKTINSKKYAFNDVGIMMSGLWALSVDADGNITDSVELSTNTKVKANVDRDVYYFGTSDDGAMKTGNQNVDVDGDMYAYAFGKTGDFKGIGVNYATQIEQIVNGGEGKEASDIKVLYVAGKKIKASSDYRYEAFEPATGEKTRGYIGGILVNTSGSIMKDKTNIKNADGKYICTDDAGVVTYYANTKKAD